MKPKIVFKKWFVEKLILIKLEKINKNKNDRDKNLPSFNKISCNEFNEFILMLHKFLILLKCRLFPTHWT